VEPIYSRAARMDILARDGGSDQLVVKTVTTD
jgi:hypothetical protein